MQFQVELLKLSILLQEKKLELLIALMKLPQEIHTHISLLSTTGVESMPHTTTSHQYLSG
jgi:hypothetical protein